MSDHDDMVVEQPPHLQEEESSEPVVKKVVLNDDENDFDSMNIRPDSLFLRGVDELSPRNIKVYIDMYLKPDNSFANKEKYEALNYKIEWINDSSLNIVFQTAESALTGLSALSSVPTDQLADTEERRAKDYVNETGEDKSAELYVRQSFSYDKKIKNARVYSRYYLLHGEPEKQDRPKPSYYDKYKSRKYRERDSRTRDEEPDLITGEIRHREEEPDLIADNRSLQERIGRAQRGRHRNRDDEEDLFPQFKSKKNRDRSRSPVRVDEEMMDVDDSKTLEERIQAKGRSMEDLLGL